jgi:hypothetical protein
MLPRHDVVISWPSTRIGLAILLAVWALAGHRTAAQAEGLRFTLHLLSTLRNHRAESSSSR